MIIEPTNMRTKTTEKVRNKEKMRCYRAKMSLNI